MLHNWKIYILSVKENIERRHHVNTFAEKAKTFGFDVEIIDGYYWKTINVIDKLNTLNISFDVNSSLSQSQLACFLSHRLAWVKIFESYKNNSKTPSIILEDDMDLHDFELFLNTEKELINEKYFNYYDGLIMWKHPDKIPTPDKIKHINNNLIRCYPQWGLCAYSIQPQLCEKMLAINRIDRPIDDYLYQIIFPKYNIMMTLNDPFENLGFLGWEKNREYKFTSLIWE
jgi:GR25 family glycosyltransferase involved in LPS biosynthesis